MNKRLIFTMLLALIAVSCAKKEDEESVTDAQSNTVQTAVSIAGSESSASEGSAAVGFTTDEDLVDPSDSVHSLATSCSYTNVRSSCSANTDTISWNGCTVAGGDLTLTGGWSESFTNACITPVAANNSITRTSTGSTITLNTSILAGATLTTDTNAGTAWDGTSIPATGITMSRGGTTTRTLTINGLHRIMKGPRGRTWFEHYIRTGTALNITGSRAGTDRQINSGTVEVFHQLLKYKASNSFSNVRWGSATCCYPTSGTITTTFSGSIIGTPATTTFTASCGVATYVDTTGASSTVTLNQCD